MKNKKCKIIKIIIVILLIVGCLYFLFSRGAYAFYESFIDGNINLRVAKWDIKVNNVVITGDSTSEISFSNIGWTNSHAIDGKAAPGSIGVADLVIDPNNTDVAFEYEFDIVDKSVDDSKILTVNSVTSDNGDIIFEDGVYKGFFSLDDINDRKKVTINIGVEWVNDDSINDFDYIDSSDFLVVNFTASQYKG